MHHTGLYLGVRFLIVGIALAFVFVYFGLGQSAGEVPERVHVPLTSRPARAQCSGVCPILEAKRTSL